MRISPSPGPRAAGCWCWRRFALRLGRCTAVCLNDDLSPGDLIVGTEVSDGITTVLLPGADLLAAELRRAGLSARAGKIATVPKMIKSSERTRLADEGYLAADMESAMLLGAANGGPAAVIRAVSDAGFGLGMV